MQRVDTVLHGVATRGDGVAACARTVLPSARVDWRSVVSRGGFRRSSGAYRTVDDAPLRLLGAVALALLFEEHDQAMVTAALEQIAAELGMAERELGLYLAMIRIGALPAFASIPLADGDLGLSRRRRE
jgi:hypothetical protein